MKIEGEFFFGGARLAALKYLLALARAAAAFWCFLDMHREG